MLNLVDYPCPSICLSIYMYVCIHAWLAPSPDPAPQLHHHINIIAPPCPLQLPAPPAAATAPTTSALRVCYHDGCVCYHDGCVCDARCLGVPPAAFPPPPHSRLPQVPQLAHATAHPCPGAPSRRWLAACRSRPLRRLHPQTRDSHHYASPTPPPPLRAAGEQHPPPPCAQRTLPQTAPSAPPPPPPPPRAREPPWPAAAAACGPPVPLPPWLSRLSRP